MIKINYMSTLFVGIDVSSKSNAVYAMDFDENKYIDASFGNNQPGADELAGKIADCMQKHPHINTIIVALESTSVYSIHIANFLASCELLMPYKPYVYCLNPKMTANYRKSYVGMDKTDHMDAFLISDFARVGRTKKCEPWRGSQYLALKRLTRHRLHLAECMTREKTYMVSNLYLKFSELQLLDNDSQPFSNLYGATASAVLTEFLSLQEIIDSPEEELLQFLASKSRNRIADISKTSELLKKAARDSYRLDKCMYGPLNVSLASSFNCIQTYQKEIKLIDQAIEKCINGMNPNAFLILKSIPGIGPVWAAGILSEIGDITAFHSSDALAKYVFFMGRVDAPLTVVRPSQIRTCGFSASGSLRNGLFTLSFIYSDIDPRSYQRIAVIHHIEKSYPVIAFLLASPVQTVKQAFHNIISECCYTL